MRLAWIIRCIATVGIMNAQLMQADHIHPNQTGVNKIADRVAPIVETALKKAE